MSLPISSVVTVSVSISPAVPPKRGFGVASVVTNENDNLGAIQVARMRFYSSITEVAVDWPTISETYLCANAYFAQNPSPTRFATISQDSIGGETEVDALTAAELFSSDWYGVLLLNTVRDTTVQTDVAAWTEARTKIFSASTNDLLTLTQGDLTSMAALLFAANYTRTICTYASLANSAEYPDAAILGKAFTTNFSAPDSVITLKFKSISSITTETINTTQKAALDEKRANILTDVAGASMYTEGWMSSQLFFDERHAVDWLVGEIESNVFGFLISQNTKVPLTDKGGAAIEQQVARALDAALNNGMLGSGTDSTGAFLATGYSIAVQKVVDMNPVDKSNRIAPSVSFVALLAGAMHFVQIDGSVER